MNALAVEAIKLARSRVGIITTVAVVLGILAICAGMLAATASGNAQVTAKLGPYAEYSWFGLLGTAAQITGAGGFVGFGIALAWIVGREFSDGTIAGLFGLPVSRARIAVAKSCVYLVWAVGTSAVLTAALLVVGLALGLGAPSVPAWGGLGRQLLLGLLTALAALPIAWVTSLTRSLLAGVGTVIGCVAIAQILVVAGGGAWVPLAAPTLWALGMDVAWVQITLVLVWGAAGVGLTVQSWRRLQLDR